MIGPTSRRRVLLLALALLLSVPPVVLAAADPLDEAIALYEAGRFKEALDVLLRVIRAQPRNARAWIWLGATRLQLRQYRETVAALNRAVALDPRSAAAHYFLAVAYVRLGDHHRARGLFERVRLLDPESPYAASAQVWLDALQSGRVPPPAAPVSPPTGGSPGTLAPSPPRGPSPAAASPRTCPPPTRPPEAKAPPALKPASASLEITDLEVGLEREELIVSGALENLGDRDVRGVRLQVTGYGVRGTAVWRVPLALAGTIEVDDVADFAVRLPTRPPAFWVQVDVVQYEGRRPTDPLHAALLPVAPAVYAPLAVGRVKVAATVIPSGPGRSHLVCMQIADPAGFPLRSVGARVAVIGSAAGRSEQQVRRVVVPPEGGSVRFTWTRDVRPSVQVSVETVDFRQLPAPAGP